MPPAPLPRTTSSPCRRARVAAVVAAALLLVAGCSGDDDDTTAGTTTTAAPTTEAGTTTTTAPAPPPPAEPGTYAVGSVEDTVVDDTRTTPAQGAQEELPERTLPVLVLYPAEGDPGDGEATADAPAEPGPWPLVVFSHGLGGTGPAYAATLRVWASAGYVVVAPTYPLSAAGSPAGPQAPDLANQPDDVSVLIDWALDRPDGDPLAGTVDPERVGISGHSLGGFTSLGAGYNPCCRDERIDAVAEWAGSYVPGLGGPDDPEGGPAVEDGPPLLIVHGDADGTVPYDRAAAVAEEVGPPWWLVTLVGGEHIPPYVTGLADPTSTVATLATLDFFDAFLKDDPAGISTLEEVVAEAGPGVATLETDEG